MKKGGNIVGIILSILVIIVFFCLEFMLGIARPVNKTMEVENLSAIMEKIDIEKIFRDEEGREKAQGTRIYKYFDKIGLPRDDVDEVVKDKAFKVIIGNYLGSMFVHHVSGTGIVYPTKAELVNFIHKNYDRFQKVTEFPEDYDQEEITRIVNENYKNVKYELDELSKDIKWDEYATLDIANKIMATSTTKIIAGLVICVILLMVFRFSLYKWLKWVSIPTMINGVITLLGGLVGKVIIRLFADFAHYDFILDPIVDDILKNMKLFGIIEIVLGIIVLVAYLVVSKIVNKPESLFEEKVEEKVEEPTEEEKEEAVAKEEKKEEKETAEEEKPVEEKKEEKKTTKKETEKKSTKKEPEKKETKKAPEKKETKKSTNKKKKSSKKKK